MWIAHGKPGGPSPAIIAKPYTLKDARDRLAEVSGDRKFADDFFDRYVQGRDEPDYGTLIARVRLVLLKRNAGGAWAGVLDQNFGGGGRGARRGGAPAQLPAAGVRIPGLVNWGTPAFNAGLEEGDVITAADRAAIVNQDDWQAVLRAHKPGDHLSVEFNRHGVSEKTTITLAEDPTVEVVTLESTGGTLSPEQKAMRDSWLASKRH
jgi:predicted metalloprotease with PDZ domain